MEAGFVKLVGLGIFVFSLAGWPDDWKTWDENWIPKMKTIWIENWRGVAIALAAIAVFTPPFVWKWIWAKISHREPPNDVQGNSPIATVVATTDDDQVVLESIRESIRFECDSGIPDKPGDVEMLRSGLSVCMDFCRAVHSKRKWQTGGASPLLASNRGGFGHMPSIQQKGFISH